MLPHESQSIKKFQEKLWLFSWMEIQFIFDLASTVH
jgi:hypothetical protein